MEATLSQKNRIYPGWNNVGAAFVGLSLSYAMFTIFSFGSFVGSLEKEFGWSHQAMAFGLTIANIAIVFLSPMIGSIVDKFGTRRVILTSLVLMGLAVAAMSQLTGEIWQLYLLYFLIPLFGAGTIPLTYSRVLITWFFKRRGLALGIALSGFGVGAALVPVVAQQLIENYGWREAYLGFAAAIFLINFPITFLLLREKPHPDEVAVELTNQNDATDGEDHREDLDEKSGLTFKQSIKTSSFWFIWTSFFLVGVGITAVLAHLIPILISRGVEPATAALCMSSLGVGLIVGRITSGFLMDRFFAPYIAALFLVGLFIGILILASGSTGSLVFVAAVLVGLATGSEISEIAYIVSRYFGAKSFGLIYGVMFAAFQLGSSIGAPGVATYYDQNGNYEGALYFISALVAVGTIMMLFLRAYPSFKKVQG